MHEFEVRYLHEHELAGWFAHVTDVFSFKGTPRKYFERHWQNDPWRDLRHIRCLFVPGNPEVLASTLRIFVRKMRLAGQIVTIGGIGEVSTKKVYEGRGFARALLNDTTSSGQFDEHQRIDLFLLHTRTAIPFYRSLGWESLQTIRLVVALSTSDMLGYLAKHRPPTNQSIKLIDFDSPEEVQALSQLHSEATCTQSGPLVRDHPDYWRLWMRAESSSENGKLPVAYILWGPDRTALGYIVIETPRPAAPGSSVVQMVIKEFFVASGRQEAEEALFGRLVAHAWEVGQWSHLVGMGVGEGEVMVEISLNMGKHRASQLFPGMTFREVVDLGFMFKLPPSSSLSPTLSPFVFYDCDGF